jgi:hypothetical protein
MACTKAISTMIALAALIYAGSAQAEIRCREGRTASGECVDPVLARVMRLDAIIRAQPKISMTAPLNLPSEDAFYQPAHDHHEERAFFGIPPTTLGRLRFP